jgi:hypothetical protein
MASHTTDELHLSSVFLQSQHLSSRHYNVYYNQYQSQLASCLPPGVEPLSLGKGVKHLLRVYELWNSMVCFLCPQQRVPDLTGV